MNRLFKPASEAELFYRPKSPEDLDVPRRIGSFRGRPVIHNPNMGDNEVMIGYKRGMSIDMGFPNASVLETLVFGEYNFLVVGVNVMNLITQMRNFHV